MHGMPDLGAPNEAKSPAPNEASLRRKPGV
jgi:hypothetical protein